MFLMVALGWITFSLGSMVGLTLLRGVVLQALWAWFIASTFGIVELTLVQAIGLSLVVSFLTYQYDARQPDEGGRRTKERIVESVIAGLFIYGFAYLLGAIVHSFA